MMLDNGDIENKTSSDEEMSPLKGSSDEEDDGSRYTEPLVGDELIMRRPLDIQPKDIGDEMHREHIFHMRCVVQNKVCSVIVDSDSCTNVD